HLTRGQTQGRRATLAGDQLDRGAGGAAHLGATTGAQLHGVHGGADRDVAQRQVVAGLDVRSLARDDRGALAQALRSEDVALLTVVVVQQRDPGGAVRVVLDVSDLGRDTVLVVALEVDQAVGLLVTAAD